MAWVEQRAGGWLGRYKVGTEKKSASVFKRKRDALEAATRLEEQAKRGQWADPALGRVTVSAWSEQWLASLSIAPKSRWLYEERLRTLILPRFGKVRLCDITLTAVKAWLSTLEGPRGPASDVRKRDAGAQLVRMLDAAVDEGLLARNPARTPSGKVSYLPAASKAKEHRYLSATELHALAAQCGDHAAMVLLTGYTGLRWGEVTALQVRDFDMLKRRLTVRRAYSIVGSQLVLGDTKNHETRVVRFPALLAEPLARLMTGKTSTDLVFCTTAGGPLDNRNFSQRVLTPAWQRAGIVRLTFHDLRHTAASLAISAGASPKAVQRMLGHASAAMTLDVYSGLFDQDAEDLGARLSALADRTALEGQMDKSAHHGPTEPVLVADLPAGQRAVDAR